MALPLWLQYLVIALVALASVLVVLRKQFPGTWRRLRGGLALWLLRGPADGWRQALGRRVAPPARAGGGACGGCDSCGPSPPKHH